MAVIGTRWFCVCAGVFFTSAAVTAAIAEQDYRALIEQDWQRQETRLDHDMASPEALRALTRSLHRSGGVTHP